MPSTTAPPLTRVDLGELPYRQAMTAMDRWRAERRSGAAGDRLFLLSHPPVITYTERTPRADLPGSGGIELVRTDRGGLATYHGPGQLVGYLVLGLACRGPLDVLRWTERCLADACARLGFATRLRDTPPGESSLAGLWTTAHQKLASVGLRIRHGVTTHGFALNVDPDLSVFRGFTACGLPDVPMTSLAEMARRAGGPVPDHGSVRDAVGAAFGANSGRTPSRTNGETPR